MKIIVSTTAGMLAVVAVLVATGGSPGTQGIEPVQETVVYSTIPPPNWDLYLFEQPGSTPRRLTTNPGLDYNPAISLMGAGSSSPPSEPVARISTYSTLSIPACQDRCSSATPWKTRRPSLPMDARWSLSALEQAIRISSPCHLCPKTLVQPASR